VGSHSSSHCGKEIVTDFCNAWIVYTHQFNGSLSGTIQVSRYQKGKTNLDFTVARDSEWQWHQLGYMQVCTSLQTETTMPAPHHSVFTARCYAFAVLAMGLCPSVSVCLSVTSRCSTKTAKRRITQTTPHSSFLKPKISAKFDWGHPLQGRQVGWVKIGDFWQIIGYISKTVKDRHIVSIKVE